MLESTRSDNVFIFFADHGAPGLIAFPSKNLYADKLIDSFAKINGKYNKLVFYLEVPYLSYSVMWIRIHVH